MSQVVFLLPLHPTSYYEFSLLAEKLNADNLQTILITAKRLPTEYAERFQNLGTPCISLSKELQSARTHITPAIQRMTRLKNRLPHPLDNWLELLITIQHEKNYYRVALQQTEQLIGKFQPRAILLVGDRHYGLERAMIHSAQKHGIRQLIVPTGQYSAHIDLIQPRQEKHSQHKLTNPPARSLKYWIRLRYPNQVWQAYLFYPVEKTLALAAMHLLPKNPWIMGANSSAVLGITSQMAYDYFLTQGIPAERLMVVGQPSLDPIFEHAQNRQEKRQALSPHDDNSAHKPLIVCALPQLKEHELMDETRHWAEIRFLAELFHDLPAEVFISLHPKADPAEYRFLERDYGLHLLEERLSDMIGIADIFLATVSSTILWALWLKIPTIMFDFYDLYDPEIEWYPQLWITQDKNTFREMLHSLVTDEQQRHNYAESLQEIAPTIAPYHAEHRQKIAEWCINP